PRGDPISRIPECESIVQPMAGSRRLRGRYPHVMPDCARCCARRLARFPNMPKGRGCDHAAPTSTKNIGQILDTATRENIKLLKSLALPRGLEPLFSP